MHIKHTTLLSLLVVMLSACSSMPDWLGAPSDPPLEGKREVAFNLSEDLQPDKDIARMEFSLPRSAGNTIWPYSRAMMNNNLMEHMAFPGKFTKRTTLPVTLSRHPDTGVATGAVAGDDMFFMMDGNLHIYGFDWSDLKKPLWKTTLSSQPFKKGVMMGGMSYYKQMLFVTTGSDHIVALDTKTGKELWRKVLSNAVRSVPFIMKDHIFVLTLDNRLYALKRVTGEQLWVHDNLNEAIGLLGSPSAVGSESHMLSPYSTGAMYSLDPRTGQEQWGVNLAFSNQALTQVALNDIDKTPVIQNDHVFVANNMGVLFTVNLENGAHIWQRDVGQIQGFWNAGEYLFVLREHELVAIHGPSAKVRWVRELLPADNKKSKKQKTIFSGPVLAGNFLYVTASNGKMIALSPKDGVIDHEVDILQGVKMPPAVVMNKMIIMNDHGKVEVLH